MHKVQSPIAHSGMQTGDTLFISGRDGAPGPKGFLNQVPLSTLSLVNDLMDASAPRLLMTTGPPLEGSQLAEATGPLK